MRRTRLVWVWYAAGLAVAVGGMAFLTLNMLRFERATADAQARAVLEENVRLALWRMDSLAVRITEERASAEDSHASSAKPEAGEELAQTDSSRSPTESATKQEKSPYLAEQQRQTFGPTQDAGIFQQTAQQELNLRNFAPVQQAINDAEYGRRAELNRITVRQASDWSELEPQLTAAIQDILPGATLAAIGPDEGAGDAGRLLAAVRARLIVPANAMPSAELPWNTPLRVSVGLAWACLLIAAGAVDLLLGTTLRLSERRGAFAGAVTHELRTPLTTFRMYAELLATGKIDGEQERREYLSTLVSESDRLGQMIDNVMAYSRLEKRVSARVLERLSVLEVIDRAMPGLSRRAEQAGIELRVNLGGSSAASVRVDAVAVQQVLLNLVDNACKYGAGPIELSGQVVDEARVEIAVSDQGPGVPANKATKLFRAFDKASDDAVPGIGLGLFLSRQLMRGMGGDLHLQYSAGEGLFNRGARFVITMARVR